MKQDYFEEVTRRLRKAGFATQTVDGEGFLPVEWQGQPLCRVTPGGGVRYQGSDMKDAACEVSCDQICAIAKKVAQIQSLMEKAPTIKTKGLDGDYRALGEFNSIVLAGRRHSYGMEFVTWEWVQDHTSLWQGHYYGDDFTAAELDFATRSGLIQAERLFSDQQLAVIFDACQSAQEYNAPENAEHERLLEGVMGQIEAALPDVVDMANELTQAQKKADGPTFKETQGMQMGGY